MATPSPTTGRLAAPEPSISIDLYVRPSPENARRVHTSLVAFGFGQVGLSDQDFIRPEHVVQLGRPPVRIDIVTSIDGVAWEECWEGRQSGSYGDTPVFFIGRDQLVKNKRAAKRYKDLADLEALGEPPEAPS